VTPAADGRTERIRQLVGVGFGPANLALAIAAEEHAPQGRLPFADMVFFERQPRFGWHRGMLIDGATMQVSFLKDLATMRNPASRYTFVAYLHDRDRLVDFINSKTVFPYRTEFHNYLEWAARRFDPVVTYDAEVSTVRPVTDQGTVRFLDVVVRHAGEESTHRTRNVVIGAGLVPRLPDGVARSERVWHSSELLTRLAGMPASARSFAVVGSGQSAAEVVSHLYHAFPAAQVHAVFSRVGYSVADDSPFANRVFDPLAVDYYHQAPDSVKDMLLGYHSGTNYSVVDLDLARQLYDVVYRENIAGSRRLHIHNVSQVRSFVESDRGVEVRLEFLPTSAVTTVQVDALVYATGYRPFDPLRLLGDLASQCKTDEHGRLVLSRDYRVVTSDAVRCAIYVHGAASEHSHGLSAGLLSNVAVRAGEIVGSIVRSID
jgi:L-ornithine N5-oxygenase